MKLQGSLWGLLAVLVAASLACSLPMFVPATPPAVATLSQLYTAAAQTLDAADSLSGSPTPSPSPTGAFPTLPGITPTLNSAPEALCDAAAFIRDVSIPDGTTVDSGEKFAKTWRLQNVGSCVWTPAYALVFAGGDRMRAPVSLGLTRNVVPGQTIDLSAAMVAPGSDGNYQGFWKLRNASGTLFGIGRMAQGAFWVSIKVAGPSYTAYDFARKYCDAAWHNNNRDLACPGSEGDGNGYVIKIEDAVLESGLKANDAGLLMVPKNAYNGMIAGRYPALKIRDGDHFRAKANCAYKAYACNVIMKLEYQVGGGKVKSLGYWNEAYEGKFYTIDLDLSALAGSSVTFILSATTNGPFSQDRALWIAPRISRRGTPPPTVTATVTPSATSTAASTPPHAPPLPTPLRNSP